MASLQSMMKDMQGVVSKVVDLQESLDNAANNGGKRLQNTFDKIGESAFTFTNVKDSIDRLSGSLDDMAAPGLKLNEAMHSLSAVSGVTGSGLKQIEGYARKAAKTFGGSATDSVNAYQLVLSQLGPHIAQVPEALAAMGDSIKTTSKLMGNDTTAAAEVLTTALNQYQVSLDDPIAASGEMARMMNVMAAAGQAGSAELPTIGEALKQSGMMAKAAGVSFEELNASIQILDKAGKKGSEGGVALRNVMGTLAKGRFLPKDVKDELDMAGVSIDMLTNKSLSMTDRLRALTPVMNDSALLSKLFGQANASAAVALIASLDPIDELTAAISGSNSAYEQAAIIMESDIEKMSRFQAKIDDIKIRLYDLYSGMLPYIKGLGSAMQMTANIAMTANAMHIISETALGTAIAQRTSVMWRLVKVTYASSGSLGIFSAAAMVAKLACHGLALGFKAIGKAIYSIPIVGWLAAGVALLIEGFKMLWDKSEGFRQILYGIAEVAKHIVGRIKEKFSGIGEFFKNIGQKIKDFFNNIIGWIVDKVDKLAVRFPKLFGKYAGLKAAFERGAEKGSASWAKDHPGKTESDGTDAQSLAEPSAMQTAMSASAAAQSGFSTGKIDLNNVKGSTNYAAVVAKLQPKAFAGLGGGKVGAAPMPGMAAEVSKPAMPELPSFLEQPEDKTLGILQRIAEDTRKIAAAATIAASTVLPVAAQVSAPSIEPVRPASRIASVERPAGREGKTVSFAKFCDRVEITVPAGTTSDQVETILNELMRRLNDALD